jgi:hypothetical protein
MVRNGFPLALDWYEGAFLSVQFGSKAESIRIVRITGNPPACPDQGGSGQFLAERPDLCQR